MSGNVRKDLKTQALVLRRTKYGETDRIISLLTPEGKIDVLARGVRKERSRLAGGIEMFCLSEVMIHQHRTDQGRGQGLATLTGARMLKFYQNILTDLPRLELASSALKGVGRLAEQVGDDGLFRLLTQIFAGLHEGMRLELVESYYLFNLARLSGEEVNLYYDTFGDKLQADKTYVWNSSEMALAPAEAGKVDADRIKLMRLMLSAPLMTVAGVRGIEGLMGEVLEVARAAGGV